MNYWEYDVVWSGIIQFGVVCLIMMLSNVLRSKVRVIKNSLIPTAVIGGIFALVLKSFVFKDFFDNTLLDKLVYHGMAVGFIALTLKRSYGKEASPKRAIEGLNSGLFIVSTYLVQGVLGMLVSLILVHTFMPNFFEAAGLLLPMGFGQGPGQANNIGNMYEQMGFSGGRSFGLSIAAIGFIVGSIVPVIYVNVLKKQGKITRKDLDAALEPVVLDENPEHEVPLSDSIDKLTLNIGIVLVVFLTAFLFMYGIDTLFIESGILGDFGTNSIRPIMWGFNFIVATLFAIVYKKIFAFIHNKKLAKYYYTSNSLLNRISGTMFDFMIISSMMLIDLNKFSSFIVPLLLIVVIGTVATFFYCSFVCQKLYAPYSRENFLAFYGMLTGTVSTGIAMVKMLDPQFKTPASINLVSGSSFAIVFGFPMLLLVSAAPNNPLFVFFACIAFFGVLNVALFRQFIFKKRNPPSQSEGEDVSQA